jgi:hypothetical protein
VHVECTCRHFQMRLPVHVTVHFEQLKMLMRHFNGMRIVSLSITVPFIHFADARNLQMGVMISLTDAHIWPDKKLALLHLFSKRDNSFFFARGDR